MPDNVILQVGEQQIQHFISYQIDSDLYKVPSTFKLELSAPNTEIEEGALCNLWLARIEDGKVVGPPSKELTGVIDRVSRKVDKNGRSLVVEGRDLMGWVVDACCENVFKSISGKTLKELAEMLLKDAPFINLKNIEYEQNVVGKGKGKKKKVAFKILDTAQKISQIEPGMTVFEVLKNYSLSRGLIFYCLPDGGLIFGRPKVAGDPEFCIKLLKSGAGNNAVEGESINDIQRRFSRVTVVGQAQGNVSLFAPASLNTKKTVTDYTVPFYKPFVAMNNNDTLSAEQHARMIMEKQRRDGFQLNYRVARHFQGDRTWRINRLCRVQDEVLKKDGVYLIYGRTFELTKEAGQTTRVRLGVPGLVM